MERARRNIHPLPPYAIAKRWPSMLVLMGGLLLWLIYAAAHGPQHFGDTQSYLDFAAALQRGSIPESERTPGYPVFLLFTSDFAPLDVHFQSLSVLVQVLLLLGIGTAFVFDIALTLGMNAPAATVAAALFAFDADLQSFSAAILSEACATFLIIALIRFRCVRGNWGVAGLLMPLLWLTRPLYFFVPLLFGAVEVFRRHTLRAAIPIVLPSAVALTLWVGVSMTVGAAPARPVQVFGPRHAFGKIYEFNLWQALPLGPIRALIERDKAAGKTVYEAVDDLAAEVGEPGIYDVTFDAAHRDPFGFLAAVLRAVPRTFRQPSLWRPAKANPVVFGGVVVWYELYRLLLYNLFGLVAFAGTMAWGALTGFGDAAGRTLWRYVIVPYVIALFAAVAVFAMGTDSVGRLGLSFRPFYGLALAAAGNSMRRALFPPARA